LAERIAPQDRAADLRSEIDKLTRARGRPGLIHRFIINPQFLEQLRERERQLADGLEPSSATPADAH
jgi:hypothetical protein